MDTVILAGGRGRRMGALTRRQQKGTLRFKGKSIFAQVIDDVLARDEIETVWVATGYRGEDVRIILEKSYADFLSSGKIVIIDAPRISGELPRFIHVLGHMRELRDCLVRGVDTLLPDTVLNALVKRISELDNDTVVVAISPKIYIAPTHHRVRLSGDITEAYDPFEQLPQGCDPSLYVDVGMRYFPRRLVSRIATLQVSQGTDFIDGFLKTAIEQGESAQVIVFGEHWRHFASGADFLK